jgi:ABC-type transporter Mla maintaining outer membrane lipid asymmetry permease subunit MlaE
MTDKEYYKTLVVGVIIGASVCILGFYMTKPEPQSITPKSNFAVVDTYKGCDIVQWSDNQMATYKYFLDCSK